VPPTTVTQPTGRKDQIASLGPGVDPMGRKKSALADCPGGLHPRYAADLAGKLAEIAFRCTPSPSCAELLLPSTHARSREVIGSQIVLVPRPTGRPPVQACSRPEPPCTGAPARVK
jgi:hypothetical protein